MPDCFGVRSYSSARHRWPGIGVLVWGSWAVHVAHRAAGGGRHSSQNGCTITGGLRSHPEPHLMILERFNLHGSTEHSALFEGQLLAWKSTIGIHSYFKPSHVPDSLSAELYSVSCCVALIHAGSAGKVWLLDHWGHARLLPTPQQPCSSIRAFL